MDEQNMQEQEMQEMQGMEQAPAPADAQMDQRQEQIRQIAATAPSPEKPYTYKGLREGDEPDNKVVCNFNTSRSLFYHSLTHFT